MLEVLTQDYIKMARAKGLSPFRIVVRYALRNALMPVVTILGTMLAGILTGTFVIEKIFAIPGMGKYFVESINNRDYPVIMGSTVFYSAFLVFMLFLVDIVYGFLDPRIKFAQEGRRCVMVAKGWDGTGIPDDWFKPKKQDMLPSRIGRQAIPLVLERCMATVAEKQISDGWTIFS